jgi:hypothetical protein
MPYALGPEHLGNPFAVGTQRRYPTARGHRLIVSDVKVACNKLLARGVVIGQMFHAKACTLGWTNSNLVGRLSGAATRIPNLTATAQSLPSVIRCVTSTISVSFLTNCWIQQIYTRLLTN